MAKGYKVASVEGRTIVDPFNTRHSSERTNAPQRRIGFTRKIDAENTVIDPRSGKRVPAETWDAHNKPEIVLETSDGFYRRAIKDGDLDYLGSVEVAADGTSKPLPFDKELLAATAVHKALREREAAQAKLAAEKAAQSADAEAEAFAKEAAANAVAAAEKAASAKNDDTTTPPSAA